MQLSRYEQETIINYNEEEKAASVYTHNKALRRKLETLAVDRPEDCKLIRGSHEGQAVEYSVPKSWIKVRPPRSVNLTDKQRAAMVSRLRRIKSEA